MGVFSFSYIETSSEIEFDQTDTGIYLDDSVSPLTSYSLSFLMTAESQDTNPEGSYQLLHPSYEPSCSDIERRPGSMDCSYEGRVNSGSDISPTHDSAIALVHTEIPIQTTREGIPDDSSRTDNSNSDALTMRRYIDSRSGSDPWTVFTARSSEGRIFENKGDQRDYDWGHGGSTDGESIEDSGSWAMLGVRSTRNLGDLEDHEVSSKPFLS
ncbi:hypothetical protein TWF730_004444 [Orbilia blumenaviensis]|uniref:Uncharacterized protein n=1 Tax=Orbilia blumenaviensis TaxID=1796055 RepID=A0AAV9U0L2_9PEZI